MEDVLLRAADYDADFVRWISQRTRDSLEPSKDELLQAVQSRESWNRFWKENELLRAIYEEERKKHPEWFR